jgi:hypothetical protein
MLTARLGQENVHFAKVDLARPKERDEFVDVVCKGRPGIDPEALSKELVRLGIEQANGRGREIPLGDALPEIDVSCVVRPDRIIAPEVSALTVPVMALVNDRPEGYWQLYVRWADGRRERKPLGPDLELPDGSRLWMHPQSADPGPNVSPDWSAPARRAWLDGAPTPDPAEVFRDLCTCIAYYIDLPTTSAPGITATLALWVILTYGYAAWDAVPYLYVGGALGSGKSRLFEVLGKVVFRPLPSSSLTGPAMYRTLHDRGGTLLLDEAERLRRTNDPDVAELLAMLLAGYRRGGQATRLEPVGDGYRTVAYQVFGPKALACIAGLPPALASRAISIMMVRSPTDSPKPRRRVDADRGAWQSLRDDLHALALEHGARWLQLARDADVCPRMGGRDSELWQPILALASWIEAHGAHGLTELLRTHALATIETGRDDQTPDHDEKLLRVLAESVRLGVRPTAGEILEQARSGESESFHRWSARAAAEHLRRYGVHTRKTGGRRVYADVTPDQLRSIQFKRIMGLTWVCPRKVSNRRKCALRAPRAPSAVQNLIG